jgi:hypothetical protein
MKQNSKLRPPRLRYLGKVAGLSVYVVSGQYVRNKLDIDFTMGGNEAIYPTYVPVGEIWLDDAAHALDRTATTLHEMVERDLMLHHGMDYDHAHDVASSRERVFRKELARNPASTVDLRRVSAAYKTYLRSPKLTVPQQLDRDIAAVVARKRT